MDSNTADIFARQIVMPGSAQAQSALTDMQDRHKDMLKLEQSVTELLKLFQDVALMVESQVACCTMHVSCCVLRAVCALMVERHVGSWHLNSHP